MSTPLIGPDGREYTLDNADPKALEHVLGQGFRVAQPGETPDIGDTIHSTALDTAQSLGAAGVGAIEGITGGLSTAALRHARLSKLMEPGLGGRERADRVAAADVASLKAFEGEHPVAHTLGELGGMLVSPVNAVAPVIEGARAATVLGRVGQKALGGVGVGTLFGAGNAISDAALGDAPLTAEKLIAGAGLGAVLGGLGGGLGGSIEEGAAKMLPKLGTLIKGATSALDDVANDAAVNATRATQGELSKFSEQQMENAGRVMRERGYVKPLSTADDILQRAESEIGAVGAEKGAILDLAEAGGAKPSYSELLTRLEDLRASKNPIEQKIVSKELSELVEGVRELGGRPVTEIGVRGSGFRALDDLRQSVAKRAKFSSGPAGVDDAALGLKRELAGVFRDEIDRQLVPQLGSDIGKHYADTKALYGSLKDIAKMAKLGTKRPSGFSLKDLATGALGGALHPFGVVGAVGAKFMREQGPAVVATVADRLAKSPALGAMAASFAKMLPETAPKLGQYGPALMAAAEQGPAHALAQHMVTAQVDPSYAATAQMAGLRPEAPDEHAAAMGRATDIAAIHGTLKAHDKAISDAMRHVVAGTQPPKASPVLKSQDFGAKRMRQDSIEAHRRRVEEVRRLATDPQALIDRVSGNLEGIGDSAPGVSAAMTATAQRAVQYLAQAAEVPPKPGPMAREWTPTEAERHKFSLKLEAVQEPASVLRHAANGTLTRQQMDAIRAVYPAFAKDIETRALEQLTSGEQMSYRARMMLTLMTGVDADGTMSPKAIAANQSALARATGKPSEQMAPPDKSKGKLGQAEMMALPGQRKELQGEAT